MSIERLSKEDSEEVTQWKGYPILRRGTELAWKLGIVTCTLYLIVVYLLPSLGLMGAPSIPFKLIIELLICGVPLCMGSLVVVERLLSERVSIAIEDELLVLCLKDRMIATCCLDIASVSGSVRTGENERPEYDTTFLLALRAGMDERVSMTYEAGVLGGAPYLRLFITGAGSGPDETADLLKREATRVEAILLASLSNIELRQLKGDDLREAALGLINANLDGSHGLSFAKSSVCLMLLAGKPRVAPSTEKSQVGVFISTALKQQYDVVFSCVFSRSKSGREQKKMERQWKTIREKETRNEDSLADQSEKRKLVRRYEKIQGSTGWFDTTVHVVIKVDECQKMQETQEGTLGIVHSIWGDDDKVLLKHRTIDRKTAFQLLLRRHMKREKIHVSRLAAFVNTPVQQLPVITASQTPNFPMPAKELVENELVIGQAVFGGRILNNIGLKTEWLREHVAILGATGTGKTTLVKHLVAELTKESQVPWWVFDIKGSEYLELLDVCNSDVLVLRPGADPSFVIDFMDSESDSKERHAHTTFAILRELLNERGAASELSPAMEKLLREAVLLVAKKKKRGNSIQTLIETISQLAGKDRTGQMTRDALMNRLEVLSREPLGSILGGGPKAVRISELMGTCVILDLQYVARVGGMDAARLLYNLIAKRIFDFAMQRGVRPGLHHVVVLEEASNLVPESYTRHSAADITTGESMVMLQRATGQGVVVVSTRPNVSSNILANTATKITFRLPYDGPVGARFMSLDKNQERYLKTLKRGRALIVMPGIEAFELATSPFDVSTYTHRLDKRNATIEYGASRSDPHGKLPGKELEELSDRTNDKNADAISFRGLKSERPVGAVFDRLGELGSHVVAFLASRSMATQMEIQGLLKSIDPRIEDEDIDEVIRDLVSLGTVDREALALVPGGFLFTLPGRCLDAVREAIADYIVYRLGSTEITLERSKTGRPDIVVDDKAILILPEHLKASSMETILDEIRECMANLGNNVTKLAVIVRGSVAAARLREIMDSREDFDAVTTISAFPTSLDAMIEGLHLQTLGNTDAKSFKTQRNLDDASPETGQADLIGAMHDVGTATNRAIQMRLWFQLIQDFVGLSDGHVQWNVLLDFIETTALQSLKSQSAPLSVEEGKRALTELLADEVLIALRVGERLEFVNLHKGLWIVNSAMLEEFKVSVIDALRKDLRNQQGRVKRNHGYYDLCCNGVSYVVFPNQQQLNTVLHLHNNIACRTCESTRIVCVLTAAEYLDESIAMPKNVQLYDFSEYLSVTAPTG